VPHERFIYKYLFLLGASPAALMRMALAEGILPGPPGSLPSGVRCAPCCAPPPAVGALQAACAGRTPWRGGQNA